MARHPTADWIVLYEGECGFCRWSMARLLTLDRRRRLRPVALESREADALLADLSPSERMASWHLLAPDGRRYSGGDAAPPLLRLLPFGRLPAALLAAAPRLTRRLYRWVADRRAKFSRAIPERSKRRARAEIDQRG